jgi:lysozyme
MSGGNKKDFWDKLSALSSFFSAVIIGTVGTAVTLVYNHNQLQIQRASALMQALPALGSSNPMLRQAGYQALITLGYPDLAAKFGPSPESRAAFAVQSTAKQTSSQASAYLPTQAVQGIDVSDWQRLIDWRSVAKSNIGFALIRSSQGATIPDNQFRANADGAQAAGIKVAAYHVYSPGDAAVQQAQWFLSRTKQTHMDFPPVLDIELVIPQDQESTERGIQAWLDAVQKATGWRPIIYVYSQILRDRGLLRIVRRYPVWVAQYSGAVSTTPFLTPWTIWQYSDQGHINGIPGLVNLDIFNGNQSGMDAFIQASRRHV